MRVGEDDDWQEEYVGSGGKKVRGRPQTANGAEKITQGVEEQQCVMG